MSIFHNTKMPGELQVELAEYGLLRDRAKQETARLPGRKMFGLRETADEYEILAAEDLADLDKEKDPFQLAVIAPDNETFDLLAPQDLSAKLKGKDEKSIRAFITKIVDSLP